MKLQTSNFKPQIFKWVKRFFLFVLASSLVSCYSFSGSSLDVEKTIQINEFPNNAPLNNPNLSQQFSTALQNRFLQRTSLKGSKDNPDILIEGEITDYFISPTSISSPVAGATGNIQAAQNKLTITVKVHYENHTVNKEKSFDRTYSDEATFNSDLSISDVENSQVKIVIDRIINKIFNDIAANW